MAGADPEHPTPPALGEPLALELGNCTFALRGHVTDGLRTVADLAGWLQRMRDQLPVALSGDDLRDVTGEDLAVARDLRDTIRSLAGDLAAGRPPSPEAVAALNRHARGTPRWRELRLEPEPHVVTRAEGRPVAQVLAAIADDAVGLFGAPGDRELRACQGPGCVLFFVRGTSRRDYCSAGCSNRARAARHYAKVRGTT